MNEATHCGLSDIVLYIILMGLGPTVKQDLEHTLLMVSPYSVETNFPSFDSQTNSFSWSFATLCATISSILPSHVWSLFFPIA